MFRLTALWLMLALVACNSNTTPTQTPDSSPTNPTAVATEAYGGLALYTLREPMGDDPEATLRAVADMGYAYVEAAGYSDGKFYGMEPADFKAFCDEVGLTPVSTHMGVGVDDDVDQMIADAKAAGFTYFVLPVPPMGAFTVDRATRTMGSSKPVSEMMDDINAIAAKCAAAGMQCLYHNHDFEFRANEAGVVPIDYFLENSDPAALNFQMDLYWVTKAEADPLDYFARYPGRFKGWHVKDMDAEGRTAPVGEGSIDFARILAAKEQSGMVFYLVEQDQTFDTPPLEAVATSRDGLAKFGFE